MKKILSTYLITTLFLTACASAPKPVMPDGRNRQAINSQASIDNYKSRSNEEVASYKEQSFLARQIDNLNKQVAELKTYLVMMQMEKDSNPKAHKKTIDKPSLKNKTPVQQTNTDGIESVHTTQQSVIFRISFAGDDFSPSNELQEKLIKAAQQAKNIDIRGRTDANYQSEANRNIALQRAMRAQQFFTAHGIEKNKIRIFYLSAGDHIANNDTPEGRLKNRRVEIEMTGLDISAFANNPAN